MMNTPGGSFMSGHGNAQDHDHMNFSQTPNMYSQYSRNTQQAHVNGECEDGKIIL